MQKNKGLIRIYKAIFYSIDGIKVAYKEAEAFRQEVYVLLLSIPVIMYVYNTWLDLILLFGSLWLVMICELLNSAIEATVDRIGKEYNTLSKKAKDMASAAVFMSVIFAIFIWLVVLYKNYM